MKLSIKNRFNLLVSELEKVPIEKADGFSAEYVSAVLQCPLKYARELFREWLKAKTKYFYGIAEKEFYTVITPQERGCGNDWE